MNTDHTREEVGRSLRDAQTLLRLRCRRECAFESRRHRHVHAQQSRLSADFVAALRAQLDRASAEEDFQAVGLLCREVLISLAQAVYDPTTHATLDGITPSATDAGRMLEVYAAHAFPGESNKEVRTHARASSALALNLQHRRTATRKLASLGIEATSSTTAVISIIARPTT